MRKGSIVLALLMCGSLAMAARDMTTSTCPPPGSAAMTAPITVPYTPPSGVGMGTTTTMVPTTPTGVCANVSGDTACLINEIRTMRGEIRASALELRGQMIINRMNGLMAREMAFREDLAANPNLPNAQSTANRLTAEADAINSDMASYAREVSMVPPDQRPYIASEMNSFDVVYWTPAQQRFAQYRTQFQANAPTVYQPAVATNPWLTGWETNYQTSLNNVAPTQQSFASTSWWTGQRVLGTTEVYPGGTTLVLPPGSVIYIPPQSIPAVGGAGSMTNLTGVMPGGGAGAMSQP